ncbi:MAG: hypothetical protein VKN72_18345 [Nostocales cyanobacterium 94392]|nr:hypothetical protein [Nostocales cyanobacterium 94392]
MVQGRLVDGKAIVSIIFRLPGQPDFSLDEKLRQKNQAVRKAKA